jgi:uncharacterized protein (TIGR03083 family)
MAAGDELFAMIAAHRRRTADLVESLSEADAATPSLCAEWTVHQVAAHLTMPFSVSLPAFAWGLVRHRGRFDAFNRAWAVTTASQRTPGELGAFLRSHAEHRFSPPGMGPGAPLTDVLVHSLDMSVPLGRANPLDPDHVDASLAFVCDPKASRNFVPAARLAGLRLISTDSGFTRGEGLEVAGPGATLLLALTGRRGGLDGLAGDGVETLRSRS